MAWHPPNHPSASIGFAQDGLTLEASLPLVLFFFPAPRGVTAVNSSRPAGYTLRGAPGTHFFASASFNQGHTHPHGAELHDPDNIALPPHIIRWPHSSPSPYQPALASSTLRHPKAFMASWGQPNPASTRTRVPHLCSNFAIRQSFGMARLLCAYHQSFRWRTPIPS